MLLFAALKHGGDELFGTGNMLNTDNTSKQNIGFCVLGTGWHDTGAVNQEDLLHEGNVLPHLSLTRDGGNGTHLLLTKSVDDGRFTNVGVSNKTHGNLLTVRVQGGELAQQVDQTTLTKRVSDRSMERKCGEILGKVFNPSGLELSVSTKS